MKIFITRYNKTLRTLLFAISTILISASAFGQDTYTSFQNGDWSTLATWRVGGSIPTTAPGTGDFVIINGHSITLDVSVGANADDNPSATGVGLHGLTMIDGSLEHDIAVEYALRIVCVGNVSLMNSNIGIWQLILEPASPVGSPVLQSDADSFISNDKIFQICANLPTFYNHGFIFSDICENASVIEGNGTIDASSYSDIEDPDVGTTYGIPTAAIGDGTICEWVWSGNDATIPDDWTVSGNWWYKGAVSPSDEPTLSDDVVIRFEYFDAAGNSYSASEFQDINLGGSGYAKNLTMFGVFDDDANTLSIYGDLHIAGDAYLYSGSSMFIDSDGEVTIDGDLTIEPDSPVEIYASGVSTGSLIVYGSASGQVLAESYLPLGPWQIVSPRVSGWKVTDFVSDPDDGGHVYGNNIIIGGNSNYGLGKYDELNDEWAYYPASYSGDDEMSAGVGYALRRDAVNIINYLRFITSGDLSVPITNDGLGWNGIGNPYTSAIDMDDFFSIYNISQLSTTYGGMYIWENGWTSYPAESHFDLQSGQGFFVNSKAEGGDIKFESSMQKHSGTTVIKSGQNDKYKFDLLARLGEKEKNTSIYFIDGKTIGLDPSYDVGLRKVNTNFEIYSKLIDGYPEVDFEHQALPDYDYDQLIIPIGLDCTDGGEVRFSLSDINLPIEAQAILEDRQTDIFTDLTGGNEYIADVSSGTYGDGRFFIHMKAGGGLTGTELDQILPLKAFYNGNQEIQIEGSPGAKAIASIFDISGKLLGNYQLNGENINIIPANHLDKGIYILKIESSKKAFRTTIPIF